MTVMAAGPRKGAFRLSISLPRLKRPLKNRELWWKVLKNLRAGVMPPAGEKRLVAGNSETIAQWVSSRFLGSIL